MSISKADINSIKSLEALKIPGWENAYSVVSDCVSQVLGDAQKGIVPAFVIMGHQGVGKSSIARKIPAVLKEINVLETRKVVKLDPFNLMGQYLDRSEERIQECIEKASNGVLLFDEAHELYVEGDEIVDDLREVVIKTLVSVIEESATNRVCVIFSGHEDRLDKLLANHSELAGLVRIIRIPDTAPEIIRDRFLENIKVMKFSLPDNKVDGVPIELFFDNLFDRRDARFFGNFRTARRLAESVCNSARSRGSDVIDIEDFGDYAQYFR